MAGTRRSELTEQARLLAAYLAAVMRYNGWTQAQLMERLHALGVPCSRRTLQYWLRGQALVRPATMLSLRLACMALACRECNGIPYRDVCAMLLAENLTQLPTRKYDDEIEIPETIGEMARPVLGNVRKTPRYVLRALRRKARPTGGSYYQPAALGHEVG